MYEQSDDTITDEESSNDFKDKDFSILFWILVTLASVLVLYILYGILFPSKTPTYSFRYQ